jgi:hypothetical protein
MKVSSFYNLGGFMKNVIFLDVDDVLNDNNSNFTLESIAVLKQLMQLYDAKVVMITSLQKNGTKARRKWIQHQFEKLGIYDIDFIDPNFEGSMCDLKLPSRLLGLIDYLRNNEIANYVILDDEHHNDYKLICLNHYRTMPFKGLTYKDLPRITFKTVYNYGYYRKRLCASLS